MRNINGNDFMFRRMCQVDSTISCWFHCLFMHAPTVSSLINASLRSKFGCDEQQEAHVIICLLWHVYAMAVSINKASWEIYCTCQFIGYPFETQTAGVGDIIYLRFHSLWTEMLSWWLFCSLAFSNHPSHCGPVLVIIRAMHHRSMHLVSNFSEYFWLFRFFWRGNLSSCCYENKQTYS